MKQTGTFLSPFESEKGRNKCENPNKPSKLSHKYRRKPHSRCKSGITKISKRNNMNKSVLESVKNKVPASIENRGNTSHSFYCKKQSMNVSASGLAAPAHKIDRLIRDNIKKNKEIEIGREIEKLQVQGGKIMKREAIHQMNLDVRKINGLKLPKKKKLNKKNLTIKLCSGTMKHEKAKGGLTTKGSFVQEFKKIRREIQEELKKEDMKFKTRVNTA